MQTFTEIREFLRNEFFANGKLYSFNEICLKLCEKNSGALGSDEVALCLTNLLREGSVLLTTCYENKTGMTLVMFRLNPFQKPEKKCGCFNRHKDEHELGCKYY